MARAVVNVSEAKGRRTLGIARGRITIPDDFDAESDDLSELFYGNVLGLCWGAAWRVDGDIASYYYTDQSV